MLNDFLNVTGSEDLFQFVLRVLMTASCIKYLFLHRG